MTGWQIYWLTRLDCTKTSIKCIAEILLVALILYAIAMGILFVIRKITEDENLVFGLPKKILKYCIVAYLLCHLFYNILPSTKEMAAIIVVPKIVNNEQVQELPENIIGLANDWIKAKSLELEPK